MRNKADIAAISLSGLCLVHCLVLPFFITLSPLISVFAENEWVHRTFVALAVPIAAFAFLQIQESRHKSIFAAFALLGCGLLIMGAFMEVFHDYELPLTVAGALLLTTAHIYRWRMLHLLNRSA